MKAVSAEFFWSSQLVKCCLVCLRSLGSPGESQLKVCLVRDFPSFFLKGSFRHPGGFPGLRQPGGRMANVAFAVTSVTGANHLGRRPTKWEIFFRWEVAVAASHPPLEGSQESIYLDDFSEALWKL